MDPCPFLRLTVESLALKLPSSAKSSPVSGVHPSTTPCFCKIRISHNFPSQTALVPFVSDDDSSPPSSAAASSASFHLDSASIRFLTGKPISLRISVYTGSMSARSCGVTGTRLLGRLKLTVDLRAAASPPYRPATFHSGWLSLGKKKRKKGEGSGCVAEEHCSSSSSARIHMVVRSEPDPRFVFQFGGEPECSPVVFQVQENNIRQPVFSCKFSNSRIRSIHSDFTNNNHHLNKWARTFKGVRERHGRERKGWMIMIHDLSGSPVAAASMITPFVPSPGTDRVSRSNPGAWLILRPNNNNNNNTSSVSTWKPWGRLEAWRERGLVDGLGYKFELVTENNIIGNINNGNIPIAESTMSVKKGGQFCIDYRVMKENGLGSRMFLPPEKGFVMGSTVEGEGKVSKPVVQVGAQHVTCMADAALFIALSAAIDLSMDACQLFSHKLRKELLFHEEHVSLS